VKTAGQSARLYLPRALIQKEFDTIISCHFRDIV